MIVAKNCYFWSVFAQISGGGYPPNSSKFPQPQFLLTCTYFGGRRHGRSLPLAKATDGLAFGVTRHCRIEGLPPMPPTPESQLLRTSTVRNAPPHQKPTSRQPMRNSQTPPRNEPKPAKTAAPKNSLTPLSDGLKKDEPRPCKTHLHTKNLPLGSPCETAKHHLETSPNLPKPQRQKTL